MTIPAVFSSLQTRWGGLDQRGKRLIWMATLLLVLPFLCWVLVAVPFRTLSRADAQQTKLDGQWQKMQSLQAQTLQLPPVISRDAAVQALQASTKLLFGNSAQLHVMGDSATVTLRNAPAASLAQWLAQARVNAHALPRGAQLLRNTASPTEPASWDGTIVLSLPVQ